MLFCVAEEVVIRSPKVETHNECLLFSNLDLLRLLQGLGGSQGVLVTFSKLFFKNVKSFHEERYCLEFPPLHRNRERLTVKTRRTSNI